MSLFFRWWLVHVTFRGRRSALVKRSGSRQNNKCRIVRERRPGPDQAREAVTTSQSKLLDAGVIIERLESKTHAAIDRLSDRASRARVTLEGGPTIPNKDFILRYDVAGKTIQDAVLAHRSDKGGFFTLILQPPERVTTDDVTPKELIFVLDTSGSMQGIPIEKAKETMKLALDNLYPSRHVQPDHVFRRYAHPL